MDVELASATSLVPFRSADACRETGRWHAEVSAVENCERTAVNRRVVRHSTLLLAPRCSLAATGPGSCGFGIHISTFRRIKGFCMVIHTKDHAEAYPVMYLEDDVNIQRRSAR